MNTATPLRLLLPAALLILAACSGSSDSAAVPRPQAYPRIEVYDSTYRAVMPLDVNLEVNAGTSARIDSADTFGTAWVTVSYPAYGHAQLYLTLSPATEDAMANRHERLSMNTGGHPTELLELQSPSGWHSIIAITPGGSAIPAQILSTDGRRMLSGSLFLKDAATNPDSVRPIVEALRSDLLHIARTLL